MAVLLGGDEPRPGQPEGVSGSSPFVIVCDHAGNRLPRALGTLGLSLEDRQRHIAWDIGAGDVAARLAKLLDAPVITQIYSRLVIDCNRPLQAVDSIVIESETTPIPGNQDLGPAERQARASEIFLPYHDQIRALLDRRQQAGRRTALVTLHSFTPVFKGVARPWHVGILFNRERRLAQPMLRLLRDDPTLVVGCNEPYAASDASDYSLVQHGENRDLPCVEIEMRQDLIADEAGQENWAERLARVLSASIDLMAG